MKWFKKKKKTMKKKSLKYSREICTIHKYNLSKPLAFFHLTLEKKSTAQWKYTAQHGVAIPFPEPQAPAQAWGADQH